MLIKSIKLLPMLSSIFLYCELKAIWLALHTRRTRLFAMPQEI